MVSKTSVETIQKILSYLKYSVIDVKEKSLAVQELAADLNLTFILEKATELNKLAGASAPLIIKIEELIREMQKSLKKVK